MPAPVKWSAADFELINTENPEGEPWLAASPDGRFNLTFFESFAGPPAYTDIETRVYSAAGLDTGLGPAPTFSATTIDHQGAVAYFPDGRSVYVWTEEPAAGGGDLEDVYAAVYVGQLVSATRFLVAGGVARQHDPVVAAGSNGFVIALADDSVGGGQLILKFYNAVGGLVTTVTDADDPEGVSTPAGTEDDYRDVEITALANGNYVVTWTDDVNFDIWARIYSPTGAAQTGLIEIEPGGSNATFPDVTALADGRFLVTYEQFTSNTVRGRIYEANGTTSVGPFTIATNAANALNQQVQSAALQDGRFVTVWRNIAGNIEGQVMFADGTADGAAFAVNGDGAGGKGRPTVATLADGRFAVSWESGAGATATIFTTIFDPREAGLLFRSASGLNDDWVGTGFGDVVLMGAGNDVIRGGGGSDYLFGEAGNDTLNGEGGNDIIDGGTGTDTMTGGLGNDIFIVDLASDITTEAPGGGTDIVRSATLSLDLNLVSYVNIETAELLGSKAGLSLTGNAGANTLIGASNSTANVLTGLGGGDTYYVGAGDTIVEAVGGGTDTVNSATVSIDLGLAAFANVENVQLNGALALGATGNSGTNTLIGSTNTAANVLTGLGGNDFYTVGAGDTIVEAAGGGSDVVFSSLISLDLASYANVENVTLTGTLALSATGDANVNFLSGVSNTAANVLTGLGGSDFYTVGAGDTIVEAAGGGTDTVNSSLISLNLASFANVENVTLTGATAGLNATGDAGVNTITGNSAANTLTGLGAADTFVFNTALGAANIDAVADFTVADDTINLENAIFTTLAAGPLSAAAFRIGAAAADADDRIIYNSATGALIYDSNGNGAGAALQFATLSAGLAMTSADFTVI